MGWGRVALAIAGPSARPSAPVQPGGTHTPFKQRGFRIQQGARVPPTPAPMHPPFQSVAAGLPRGSVR